MADIIPFPKSRFKAATECVEAPPSFTFHDWFFDEERGYVARFQKRMPHYKLSLDGPAEPVKYDTYRLDELDKLTSIWPLAVTYTSSERRELHQAIRLHPDFKAGSCKVNNITLEQGYPVSVRVSRGREDGSIFTGYIEGSIATKIRSRVGSIEDLFRLIAGESLPIREKAYLRVCVRLEQELIRGVRNINGHVNSGDVFLVSEECIKPGLHFLTTEGEKPYVESGANKVLSIT